MGPRTHFEVPFFQPAWLGGVFGGISSHTKGLDLNLQDCRDCHLKAHHLAKIHHVRYGELDVITEAESVTHLQSDRGVLPSTSKLGSNLDFARQGGRDPSSGSVTCHQARRHFQRKSRTTTSSHEQLQRRT